MLLFSDKVIQISFLLGVLLLSLCKIWFLIILICYITDADVLDDKNRLLIKFVIMYVA